MTKKASAQLLKDWKAARLELTYARLALSACLDNPESTVDEEQYAKLKVQNVMARWIKLDNQLNLIDPH